MFIQMSDTNIKVDLFQAHALFIAQAVISGFTMAFSAAMIITGGDPVIYLPIITSTAAYWLPTPLQRLNTQAPAPKVYVADAGTGMSLDGSLGRTKSMTIEDFLVRRSIDRPNQGASGSHNV